MTSRNGTCIQIRNVRREHIPPRYKSLSLYLECIGFTFQQIVTLLGSHLLALEGLQVHTRGWYLNKRTKANKKTHYGRKILEGEEKKSNRHFPTRFGKIANIVSPLAFMNYFGTCQRASFRIIVPLPFRYLIESGDS
jgi:hypothetical protein